MGRKLLEAVVFGPVVVTLSLLLSGGFAGMVGGLAGWDNVRTAGEAVFDFGAVGLVAWLFLTGMFPAEILDSPSNKPRTPASSTTAAIGKRE
jgi:hypothetical protein